MYESRCLGEAESWTWSGVPLIPRRRVQGDCREDSRSAGKMRVEKKKKSGGKSRRDGKGFRVG